MKIEDYLPKYIKYKPNYGYEKCEPNGSLGLYGYATSSIVLEINTNIIYNINQDSIFTVDYICQDIFDAHTINVYDEYYDNNFDNILLGCIRNFNNRIGNIYDFVDIYRRRNLILKDLI